MTRSQDNMVQIANADGKNIVRGLIQRGYSGIDIRKIAGGIWPSSAE